MASTPSTELSVFPSQTSTTKNLLSICLLCDLKKDRPNLSHHSRWRVSRKLFYPTLSVRNLLHRRHDADFGVLTEVAFPSMERNQLSRMGSRTPYKTSTMTISRISMMIWAYCVYVYAWTKMRPNGVVYLLPLSMFVKRVEILRLSIILGIQTLTLLLLSLFSFYISYQDC